jgi:hypothetical protein
MEVGATSYLFVGEADSSIVSIFRVAACYIKSPIPLHATTLLLFLINH